MVVRSQVLVDRFNYCTVHADPTTTLGNLSHAFPPNHNNNNKLGIFRQRRRKRTPPSRFVVRRINDLKKKNSFPSS